MKNWELNEKQKSVRCNSNTYKSGTSADVCVYSLSQTIMVRTIISHELDLGGLSTWTRSIVHRLLWIVLLHSTSIIMHGVGNQHTTCSGTKSGMHGIKVVRIVLHFLCFYFITYCLYFFVLRQWH